MDFPLNVFDKLLLHLALYEHLSGSCIFPREMTQCGISESFRVSRGHVAHGLKTLECAGLVYSRVERVSDGGKRKNVYRLTDVGLKEAKRLSKAISELLGRPPAVDGGAMEFMNRHIGQNPKPVNGPRPDFGRDATDDPGLDSESDQP